jgi:hypothetical protein
MIQKYEVWDIIPGRIIYVSVEAVIDDWEGFRIMLRDHETNRMIRVLFEYHVAYQNRDESDLEGEASRSEGLGRGCFYCVKNSEFEQRFRVDSLRQCKEFKHFAIITDAACIDILAIENPEVTQF